MASESNFPSGKPASWERWAHRGGPAVLRPVGVRVKAEPARPDQEARDAPLPLRHVLHRPHGVALADLAPGRGVRDGLDRPDAVVAQGGRPVGGGRDGGSAALAVGGAEGVGGHQEANAGNVCQKEPSKVHARMGGVQRKDKDEITHKGIHKHKVARTKAAPPTFAAVCEARRMRGLTLCSVDGMGLL